MLQFLTDLASAKALSREPRHVRIFGVFEGTIQTIKFYGRDSWCPIIMTPRRKKVIIAFGFGKKLVDVWDIVERFLICKVSVLCDVEPSGEQSSSNVFFSL